MASTLPVAQSRIVARLATGDLTDAAPAEILDLIQAVSIDRQINFTTPPSSFWSFGDPNFFTGDLSRAVTSRYEYGGVDTLPEQQQTTTSLTFWIPPEVSPDFSRHFNGLATWDGSGETTEVNEPLGWSKVSPNNPATITDISIAAQAVITVASHTLVANDRLYIIGPIVGDIGDVLVSKRHDVVSVTPTTITINTDTTGKTYTSGGTVRPANQRTALPGKRVINSHYGDGEAILYNGSVLVGKENPYDSWYFGNAAVFIGGDVTGIANGSVINAIELNLTESNGADITALGSVRNMNRTTDTSTKFGGATNQSNDYSAKDCVWLGYRPKSIGTAYCDSAFVPNGKWKVGLDFSNTTFADFDVAIALKQGDKIHFNASAVANTQKTNTGHYATVGLDVANSIYMEASTTSAWRLVIKNTPILSASQTQVTSAGLMAGTGFKVGANLVVTSRQTGYTNAMTGTADRATSYATSTITLEELAERVKALQDDLTTHGMIGI